MIPSLFALSAPRLFDGTDWHENSALIVEKGRIAGLMPITRLDPGLAHKRLDRGFLAPGFVDLQVNGGGGVLFNTTPTRDTIQTMVKAHAAFGTTALLPTLITDTDQIRQKALEAAISAATEKVPGFAGLHLEGPHLSPARKGTHDPRLMRPMNDQDIKILVMARKALPALMLTVAPEMVTPAQVAELKAARITISLGHTNASSETVDEYVRAGATLVTHLFNAQSQMQARAPGVVGAALANPRLSAGLIADGHHVDPRMIGIALRAKTAPGRIFLVTDAMATIGTDLDQFELGGRTIFRKNGRLTLADGTLAGADLDMATAVRNLVSFTDESVTEALKMASLYPAKAMAFADRGHLSEGAHADLIWLDANLGVKGTWIGGQQQ